MRGGNAVGLMTVLSWCLSTLGVGAWMAWRGYSVVVGCMGDVVGLRACIQCGCGVALCGAAIAVTWAALR